MTNAIPDTSTRDLARFRSVVVPENLGGVFSICSIAVPSDSQMNDFRQENGTDCESELLHAVHRGRRTKIKGK
jgi:hypothetical protein